MNHNNDSICMGREGWKDDSCLKTLTVQTRRLEFGYQYSHNKPGIPSNFWHSNGTLFWPSYTYRPKSPPTYTHINMCTYTCAHRNKLVKYKKKK